MFGTLLTHVRFGTELLDEAGRLLIGSHCHRFERKQRVGVTSDDDPGGASRHSWMRAKGQA